jgi:hypothetical protein
MVVDLSPGDVIRFGDDITLTVLAVGNGLVRFGLDSPDECQSADVGERADLKPRRGEWEMNQVLSDY